MAGDVVRPASATVVPTAPSNPVRVALATGPNVEVVRVVAVPSVDATQAATLPGVTTPVLRPTGLGRPTLGHDGLQEGASSSLEPVRPVLATPVAAIPGVAAVRRALAAYDARLARMATGATKAEDDASQEAGSSSLDVPKEALPSASRPVVEVDAGPATAEEATVARAVVPTTGLALAVLSAVGPGHEEGSRRQATAVLEAEAGAREAEARPAQALVRHGDVVAD